jgi:molybdopterin-guanine dinucleotide biosynthesis protein A
MYSHITGIILSGGRSLRMGENKSFLMLNGKTVIEHVIEKMRGLFSRVILITNQPNEYEFLGIEMFEDVFKFEGPLAGIHSGLVNSQTEKNFVISCDLPLMKKEMITFIVDHKTEKPITVTKADGFIQQLCGVYSQKCIPICEELLTKKEPTPQHGSTHKSKCKVLQLLEIVGSEILDAEKIPCYKDGMFLNMNEKAEYNKVVKRFNRV